MSVAPLLFALVWMIFMGIIIFREYSGNEEGSPNDLWSKIFMWLLLGFAPVIGALNMD